MLILTCFLIRVTFQANSKLREFFYKSLRFEEELDNLFIGNSAIVENAWVPSEDETVLSDAPVKNMLIVTNN